MCTNFLLDRYCPVEKFVNYGLVYESQTVDHSDMTHRASQIRCEPIKSYLSKKKKKKRHPDQVGLDLWV